MISKKLFAVLLVLLCLTLLVSGFKIELGRPEPGTIIVPDNYPTIQEGINHAIDGDTVFVRAGTYHENVNVNETVSLIGEDRDATVIDGGSSNGAAAVVVSSERVIFRGFKTRVNGSNSIHILLNATRDAEVINSIVMGLGVVASSIIGVQVSSSENITLDGNDFVGVTGPAVGLYNSSQVLVTGNNVTQSSCGISLEQSNSNRIFHNNFLNNTIQVLVENSTSEWDDGYPSGGNSWSDYSGLDIYKGPKQDILGGDGIGDTPYIIDAANRDRYPFVKSSPLRVHNMNTGLEYQMIQEVIDANETLSGHTIFAKSGLYFESVVITKSLTILGEASETTTIFGGFGNAVTVAADNVTITGFTVRTGGELYVGLFIEGYGGTNVHNDNFTMNVHGIELSSSSNNMISENLITNNQKGVVIEDGSSDNTLVNNLMERNNYGIWLEGSYNNNFHHNSFLTNAVQAHTQASFTNVWNSEYPSGGNYWSDYTGADLFSGPYQNETGEDGIGDTLYVIDVNNTDHYPLMGPWTMAGTNVTVVHSTGVSLTFENVTSSGITTVNETQTAPDPPQGFEPAVETPVYYDIGTTANYSGTIGLSIPYNQTELVGQEQSLQLMRWNDTSQQWVDIATYVDVQNNVTYGETDHLSLYALFVPTLVGDVNSDGAVDIYDAILLANAFGSSPGSPKWDVRADLKRDNIIDIFDAILLSGNYGKTI